MTDRKIEVVIKAKTPSELFRAYIDQARIHFQDGEAVLSMVPKNEDYVLSWFIRGAPGTKYEIAVVKPERIKMNHKAALDASGKDAGLYWFKI